MTLTHLDLDRIDGLAKAATPGPWLTNNYGTQVLTGDSWNTVCELYIGKDHRLASWEDGRGATDVNSNADFIAALDPTTVLALIARIRELEADKARLDWLERHTVNVRDPLVYGSRDMFWAGPHTEDGITDPSDLRAQIDAALQRKTP